MTSVLTPELVLAYVRELSCDVVAAALRAPDGTPMAGDPVGEGEAVRVRAAAGELVLGLGPCALPSLVRHDGAAALAALSRPGQAP
jgi:hypothetical protein